AILVDDVMEGGAQRIDLAQAERLAAYPEQSGLVDQQGGDVRRRQAAAQVAVAADVTQLGGARIELEQSGAGDRHPDRAVAILDQGADLARVFLGPDQGRGAAERIEPVQALAAADQDRMVLALDDAVQLVRQVGGDAIGAARPGGYLPQTAGAGGPERT